MYYFGELNKAFAVIEEPPCTLKELTQKPKISRKILCASLISLRVEPNILIAQKPCLLLYYAVKSQLWASDHTLAYQMDFFLL